MADAWTYNTEPDYSLDVGPATQYYLDTPQYTDNGSYWSSLGSTYTTPAQTPAAQPQETAWYQDPSLLSGAIGAGTTLAGIYFQQKNQRDMAEEAIKQRQAELDYQREMAAKAGRGGGGGGGARSAALAAMYNNYANLMAQAGQSMQQGAIETGRATAAPILARVQTLK